MVETTPKDDIQKIIVPKFYPKREMCSKQIILPSQSSELQDILKYSNKKGHQKYMTSSTLWDISQLVINDIQSIKTQNTDSVNMEGGTREM